MTMTSPKTASEQRMVLSASTLSGEDVRNLQGQDVGHVKELMIDIRSGRVAYAVLSFGGFFGLGDKLFAVPWSALRLDQSEKVFILDVDKPRLEQAPGFDKEHWPDMADPAWTASIDRYYGVSAQRFDG